MNRAWNTLAARAALSALSLLSALAARAAVSATCSHSLLSLLCSHSLLALTARTHYSHSLLAPLSLPSLLAYSHQRATLSSSSVVTVSLAARSSHQRLLLQVLPSLPSIPLQHGFGHQALGFTWLTAPQSTAKHGDAMTGLSSSGLSGQPCKHCPAQPPRSIRKLDNNAHGKQRSVGWMDG